MAISSSNSSHTSVLDNCTYVSLAELTGLSAEFRNSDSRSSHFGRALSFIRSAFGLDTSEWPWIATAFRDGCFEASFTVSVSCENSDSQALNWIENKLREAQAFGIEFDEDETGDFTFSLKGLREESSEIIEDIREFARDFRSFERNEWKKAA